MISCPTVSGLAVAWVKLDPDHPESRKRLFENPFFHRSLLTTSLVAACPIARPRVGKTNNTIQRTTTLAINTRLSASQIRTGPVSSHPLPKTRGSHLGEIMLLCPQLVKFLAFSLPLRGRKKILCYNDIVRHD